MAQVALLHTEINSGFRLSPRIGINSAGGRDMDMPSNHLRTHRLCNHQNQKH